MMVVRWRGLALVLLTCAACSRSGGTLELLAPFSDDTVVGQVTASWRATGQARADAGGAAEREVAFRIDAVNRLSDRLYVRLRGFRLIAGDGTASSSALIAECTLAPGTTPAVLRGTLWMPAAEVSALRGFQLDHFALPLSERGRAFYREFLLQQRPDRAAAIDAELTAYAAAPACRTAQ
jgi:hypothetical protein